MKAMLPILTTAGGDHPSVDLLPGTQIPLYVAMIAALASVVVAWINTHRTHKAAAKTDEDHGIVIAVLEQLREDLRSVREALDDHVRWELRQKYPTEETTEALRAALHAYERALGIEPTDIGDTHD